MYNKRNKVRAYFNSILWVATGTLLYVSSLTAQNAKVLLSQADSLTQTEQYMASTKILEALIANFPERKYDQSKAHLQISYNYMQLGLYDLAESQNKKSEKIRKKVAADELAENYMRYGSIALLKGDYESAFDYLFNAKESPVEDPQLYALINGYLGNTFAAIQDYENALSAYDEAQEILEIELGDDHPDVATNLYNKAKVYIATLERNAAEQALERALEIELANGNRKAQSGQIYTAQAQVALLDEKPEKALALHEKALITFKEIFGSPHKEISRSHLNMARIHFAQSEISKAKQHIQQAIINLSPGFKYNAFDYNPTLEAPVLDQVLMVQALKLKAAAWLFDYSEEKQQSYLIKALESAELGIAFLEDHIDFLSGEVSMLQFLEKELDIFEEGIIAANELFQRTKDIDFGIKAFEISEQAKATILRRNIIPMIESGDHFSTIRKMEEKSKQFIRECALELELNPDNDQKWFRLAEARSTHLRFLKQVKKKNPEYYTLRYQHAVVNPIRLQETLSEKEIILSYFLGEQRYFIFAISADNFQIFNLPNDYSNKEGKLAAAISEWAKISKKEPDSGVGVYSKLELKEIPIPSLEESIESYLLAIKKVQKKPFALYSNVLYSKLINPVAALLKGKKKLIIIPHKSLHLTPFEAFTQKSMEDKKIKYNKLDYLIKDFEIRYQHSATLYATRILMESGATGSTNFLGIAPVFDPAIDSGYIWSSHNYVFDTSYQNATALRMTSPDGKQFAKLEYSENEVKQIANLYAAENKKSYINLHADASEELFKKQAKDARILHLATHSFANTANPKLSGIVFSQPTSKEAKDDGILYTPEIYGLDLNADLVVLSSCESGYGQLMAGEGSLSLSRAFLEAGAANVMSSLWKVYDSYTLQLMTAFYENALDGKTYPESLRAAKLKLIKNKAGMPKKWAGFILNGN